MKQGAGEVGKPLANFMDISLQTEEAQEEC